MGFYLSPKTVIRLVEPWGMRMQWEHTTLTWEENSKGNRIDSLTPVQSDCKIIVSGVVH